MPRGDGGAGDGQTARAHDLMLDDLGGGERVARAIFLSYRREDSAPVTIHIYRWLLNHGVPAEEISSTSAPFPPVSRSRARSRRR